jgi:hypothetical protein
MEIKNLWEQFVDEYLFEGVERNQHSNYNDKQLYRVDVITAFSVFVNYNMDKCIHILKDRQLTGLLWRDLCKRYDMTRLYINEEKLYQLL